MVIANIFPKLQTVKDLVWAVSKKSRFRTSFDSQLAKVSQTLVKSAWEHFDHLFWWAWRGMSWKTSPLLKFLMIGVFVNTLTPDYKFWIVPICRSLFKCSCVKNEKLFLNFLFHLWNLHQILNIFKKYNILIANVFPKLQTVKDLVRPLSKKNITVSEHPLTVNMLKGPKDLRNLHESTFIIFFYHSEGKWFQKDLPYWSLKS